MADSWIYLISVVGGFVAGIVNTFAGNGSVITLGILTELVGLPANIANGTNRIGVLLQGIGSYQGLKNNYELDYKKERKSIFIIIFGAIAGGISASMVSNENFDQFYKMMMLVMLVVILAKPSRWISPTKDIKAINPILLYIIYFLLGFYGGFIQMGMGLLFLATMVLVIGKPIMESNLLKVFIVLLFSIAVLPIFIYHDLVAWRPGLMIAVGQTLGGYFAGRYMAKSEKANILAYYILVTMVIVVVIKIFVFNS